MSSKVNEISKTIDQSVESLQQAVKEKETHENENNTIEIKKNKNIKCVILFMIEQLNNFIFNYFINPITDYNSYNLINSIIYALILFLIVWLLKYIFKISKIEINNKLKVQI